MRHRHSRLRLRQKPAHSRALQRNLVTSVLLYETVRTTKKRAQVVQPIVEHIITVAKKKLPHIAIRSINAIVTHKNACRKTMEVLKPRYATRTSGFTRIVAVGSRIGDGAKLVHLQLVDAEAPMAPAEAKVKAKELKKAKTKQRAASKKNP